MPGHTLRRKRKDITRWLHAGVYMNANNKIRNIWYAFQKIGKKGESRKKECERLVYAADRLGNCHGRYGAGRDKRDVITWNKCYYDRWSKSLDQNGTWQSGIKITSREHQRTILLEMYKDLQFHDPHPEGINARNVGPRVDVIHDPDKTSYINFESSGEDDDDDDTPPGWGSQSPEDEPIALYPGTKIPQSTARIKCGIWKEVHSNPLEALKKFFRGDLAVDSRHPKFYEKQIDIIESLFLECGWRVDREAVEGAYDEICRGECGNVLQSRAWQAAPPFRVDRYKGDKLQKVMGEVADDVGTRTPFTSSYDEVESRGGDTEFSRRETLSTRSIDNEEADNESEDLCVQRKKKSVKKSRTNLKSSWDFVQRVSSESDEDWDANDLPRKSRVKRKRATGVHDLEDGSGSETKRNRATERDDVESVNWLDLRFDTSARNCTDKAFQKLKKLHVSPDMIIDKNRSTPRSDPSASNSKKSSRYKSHILANLRTSILPQNALPPTILPSIERDFPANDDIIILESSSSENSDVEVVEKPGDSAGNSSTFKSSARRASKSTERYAQELGSEGPESSTNSERTNDSPSPLVAKSTRNLVRRHLSPAPTKNVQGKQPILNNGGQNAEAIDLTMETSTDPSTEGNASATKLSTSAQKTSPKPNLVIDLSEDFDDSDDDLTIDEGRSSLPAPKGLKKEPKAEIIE